LNNKGKIPIAFNSLRSGTFKSMIVLFILIFTSSIFMTCTSDTMNDTPINDEATIIDENSVTVDEARKAALQDMQRQVFAFPEWEGAELGDNVYIFHVPSGAKCAYEFAVIKDGVQVGFILTSARKDWMPVLEGGGGGGSGPEIEKARQIIIDRGMLDKDDESPPTLYYFGALSRSAQFGQKMKDARSLIELASGRLFHMPEQDPVLQTDEDRANAAWEYVLSNP
jgi:hypothetical protein